MINTHMAFGKKCKFMGFFLNISFVYAFEIIIFSHSNFSGGHRVDKLYITRGSQEPVIAHLVFHLTSKVDRKWGCYT